MLGACGPCAAALTKSRLYRPGMRHYTLSMSRRFLALFATVALAAWTLPALAQSIDPEPLKPIEPPGALARAQRGGETQNLDRLFAYIKVATDSVKAKNKENRQ